MHNTLIYGFHQIGAETGMDVYCFPNYESRQIVDILHAPIV